MARLRRSVKHLILKSRDSAVLAVDFYNKPDTRFKSYGYIVLMSIAWTSLFHALFERDRIKYFYRKKESRRYVYVDGERKTWELEKSLQEYFGDNNPPMRQNLRFFAGLRNKIEHRFLPALDLEVVGECQALLMNYEKLLTQEFGDRFGLNQSLAIPLQLASTNPEWRNKALKEMQSREYEVVKRYIDVYRASLDDSVWSTSEFSFRVFLVPKIGNRESTSDVSVEFVPYDPDSPEDMEKYERLAAFIREKQVPVVNPGRLKPGDVAKRVKDALGRDFSASYHHAKCWRFYRVRPEKGSKNPRKTKVEYCQYDEPHHDYVYTEEWVKFLVSELSNEQKRKAIMHTRSPRSSKRAK